MELSLEHRQIAIAIVEYLRKEGYILSPEERKELQELRDKQVEYVSGKEAAKLLGCTPAYVIKMRKDGLLTYRMVGSTPKYSLKSINRYINKRTIKDSQEA